ncbi:hypothetical protein B0H10DRAFT_2283872 [Mycena sp. CBHHK59/15]|nr:hypothetical protein B0H10DRAFT_2283872 [Mycena sp. CBHHK59/15]
MVYPGSSHSSSWAPPQARPPPTEFTTVQCFGIADNGDGCSAEPTVDGFCGRHIGQGVWLERGAAGISYAARNAHACNRKCCGLTLKRELCRNNLGGNFRYCWRHVNQAGPAVVQAAQGFELPQRATIRQRMSEFCRMKDEAASEERQWRDRFYRESERARREQQQQEQQQREGNWRREQEEARARRERARQQQQQQQHQYGWQWGQQRQQQQQQHNRYQRESEQRRQRQQQQEQESARARQAQEERQQREAERNAREEAELRGRISTYITAGFTFDQRLFSEKNPNSFHRIP